MSPINKNGTIEKSDSTYHKQRIRSVAESRLSVVLPPQELFYRFQQESSGVRIKERQ